MSKRVYARSLDLQGMKDQLLQIARTGGARPKTHSGMPGRLLCQFTCKTSASYFDAVFDATIRALRPDWFTKTRNNPEGNKAALLDIARAGEARPANTSPLGNALGHYAVSVGNPSYDGAFSALIRSIRPDWFMDCRKAMRMGEILAAAEDETSLRPTGALGRLLRSLVEVTSDDFDADFSADVRARRPDWFAAKLSRKDELLAIARAGGDKPAYRSSLYNTLCSATDYRTAYFDVLFDSEIRALRPEWFKPRRVRNPAGHKADLIALARNGEARPHHSSMLGIRLVSYTRSSSTAYDANFSETIRSMRPDWFLSRRRAAPAHQMVYAMAA